MSCGVAGGGIDWRSAANFSRVRRGHVAVLCLASGGPTVANGLQTVPVVC